MTINEHNVHGYTRKDGTRVTAHTSHHKAAESKVDLAASASRTSRIIPEGWTGLPPVHVPDPVVEADEPEPEFVGSYGSREEALEDVLAFLGEAADDFDLKSLGDYMTDLNYVDGQPCWSRRDVDADTLGDVVAQFAYDEETLALRDSGQSFLDDLGIELELSTVRRAELGMDLAEEDEIPVTTVETHKVDLSGMVEHNEDDERSLAEQYEDAFMRWTDNAANFEHDLTPVDSRHTVEVGVNDFETDINPDGAAGRDLVYSAWDEKRGRGEDWGTPEIDKDGIATWKITRRRVLRR